MLHLPQVLLLLALMVFLPPATIKAQLVPGIPTINLEAFNATSTGSIRYYAKLALQTGPLPLGASPDRADFLLDLNAQHTILSFNCTRKTTKAELWALVIGDSGVVANPADSQVGSIDVICKKKHGKNVAALSSLPSSLPSQVVPKLDRRPLRFATVLRGDFGSLFIGRISWVQYVGLADRVDVSFVSIPLKLAPSGGYLVELTGVSFKTSLANLKFDVEMSTTERYTKLPSKLYHFLLGQFQHEAAEKQITQAPTSYGKLTRCYNMKTEDRSSFRNVTMVFSGKSRWSVSGEEYLVQKPASGNVFCLGYLEAATGHAGVIGTLQQLGRVIEYRLDSKTLAVSLPLVGALVSP